MSNYDREFFNIIRIYFAHFQLEIFLSIVEFLDISAKSFFLYVVNLTKIRKFNLT